MSSGSQAYMDLLLGTDSRPGQDANAGTGEPRDSTIPAGAVPAGFAGTVNLIVPLATAAGPGRAARRDPGIGPIETRL